jgi:hypothetical protein
MRSLLLVFYARFIVRKIHSIVSSRFLPKIYNRAAPAARPPRTMAPRLTKAFIPELGGVEGVEALAVAAGGPVARALKPPDMAPVSDSWKEGI